MNKTVNQMIDEGYKITYPFKIKNKDREFIFINDVEFYEFLENNETDIYPVPYYKCVNCGKKIHEIYEGNNIDESAWENGTVGTINIGYGSKYDDDVIEIGICDDCIDKLNRLGKLNFIKKPKVMIAGHMDEVGFMVKKIDDNGFIKFQTLGGWWGHVLLAQEVTITNSDNQKIDGVIGSTPPHLLKGNARDNVVKPEDMFIDIGISSKKEVEKLNIKPGDMITPKVEFQQMSDQNYLKAKAFDNRVGCGVAIEVMKNLKDNCPIELYSVGTVQEEVGLRGAGTVANKINPDVAFVVDVTLAGDMPGVSGVDGKLGGGPMVVLMDATCLGNKKLRDLAVETAKELNMNIEFEIFDKGGTDAGRIHMSGEGVPTLGFALPSRYIHSHTSMIHYKDYKNLIKLITEMVKKIDWNLVNKLND